MSWDIGIQDDESPAILKNHRCDPVIPALSRLYDSTGASGDGGGVVAWTGHLPGKIARKFGQG